MRANEEGYTSRVRKVSQDLGREGSGAVPPLFGSRGCKLVDFGNCDESRRVVVESLRDGLHSVDSDPLKCPFVIVSDARNLLLAMRLTLLVFYVLAVVVSQSQYEVSGFDVTGPTLCTMNKVSQTDDGGW